MYEDINIMDILMNDSFKFKLAVPHNQDLLTADPNDSAGMTYDIPGYPLYAQSPVESPLMPAIS